MKPHASAPDMQAGSVIKPGLALVVGLCLLLAGLTLACVLRFPHIEGRFDVVAGKVTYTPALGTPSSGTSAEGQVWHRVALSAGACTPSRLDLLPGDVRADVTLFDPVRRQADTLRQAQIRCLLASPATAVSGHSPAGPMSLSPVSLKVEVRPRTPGDLGPDVWGPLLMAVAAFLVSGWVWSLRPRELATRLFAVNGFTFMVCYLVQAVYKGHGLGYDPGLFETLFVLNDVSNLVFFLSLVALFLLYPVRLVTVPKAWGLAGLGGVYIALLVIRPDWVTGLGLIATLGSLLATIGLIGWQWWATRREPRARAALTWLALSVLIGASLWAVMLMVTLHLEQGAVMGEVYVVALFFPFYLGLAMGVARFCLVELRDWTFRILFLVLAALLFATVDAALVIVAGMGSGVALAIALFAIAFCYLPLRDLFWRRFVKPRSLSRPDMFAAVMDIAFAPTPGQRSRRWEALVARLFDPLHLEAATSEVAEARIEARIEDGGLRLLLPAAADAPALNLAYARQGRALFSPSELALVRQLIALVRTASDSRDAYERGAAEERRRLAQDLHDDVGARLLSGLSIADERTRPVLHGALADIRAIAAGLIGIEAPLDRVCADIRHECVRRLEDAGIAVDWPLWPQDASLVLADYRLQKALASAVREAISNIIRHSGASGIRVDLRLADERVVCTLSDNGRGLPEEVLSGEGGGQGLKGIVRRIAEAGGAARFGNAPEGGARVTIELPLAAK